MVAIYLGVEPNEVLEAAADDEAHVDMLENFIKANGIIGFIVYYQEGPSYEIGKKSTPTPGFTFIIFCCKFRNWKI